MMGESPRRVKGWVPRGAVGLIRVACGVCSGDRSSLASFAGRPQDISPKARYHLMMGKLFPAYYG